MPVYENGELELEPPKPTVRTDCINCGAECSYAPNQLTTCLPRGNAKIFKIHGNSHFIIVLNNHSTASCRGWADLDESIAHLEKANDSNIPF